MAQEAKHTSLWERTTSRIDRPALEGELETDVAIIGSGVTGLTCALELVRAGRTLAVIEAQHVGSGASGHTTAHLSTMWDGRYGEIRGKYGDDTARIVHDAMRDAIEHVGRLVDELAIDCAFERIDGYLYAELGQSTELIEREHAAAKACGFPVEACREVPLPFPVARGLRVRGQAQLHALDYLQGLASAVEQRGGQVYEHSRVVEVRDGEPCRLLLDNGAEVRARDVVMATHTPLGLNALHTQVAPYRSYVQVIETSTPPGSGLFWDAADPYHYVRRHRVDGCDLVIVGGTDRKTAHGSEQSSFDALSRYVADHFEVTRVDVEWSAQLYEPADRLPFIGKSPFAEHTYLGTGYSGDGITFGTTAGIVIAHLVLGRPEPRAHAFRPARLHAQALRRFAGENLDVARQMVVDRIRSPDGRRVDGLRPGEGTIIASAVSPTAVYRDDDGALHRFSAVCPHLACVVHWNDAQKTFDCPCHGSRFGSDGAVIEGPALTGLSRRDER